MTGGHAVEMGQGPIAALVTQLSAAEQVSYRLVLVQPPMSSWLLHTLLVDVLPHETHRSEDLPFSYFYRDVHALGGQIAGSAISLLLERGGKVAEFADPINPAVRYVCGVPPLPDVQASGGLKWFRFPSRSGGNITPMLWPHTRYEPFIQNSTGYPGGQIPHHFLINEGCPFFPDIETLLAELIYRVPRNRSTDIHLSNPVIAVRIADARSWFDHVEIAATSMRISIRGTDPRKGRLHSSGVPALPTEIDLQQVEGDVEPSGEDEQRFLTMPLAGDLPSSFHLLLAHGTDWRDYRVVSPMWTPFQASQPGVTVSPPDLPTQIDAYIYQGEGPQIEFKHQPPTPQDTDQKERLLKTVAAFANGDGGVILVGIEDESGAIVGINTAALPKQSIPRLRDTLVSMIRTTVVPEPEIDIQHCKVHGKYVLVLYVNQGTDRPYGLNPAKPVFYIRRGATTFPARPDEVRALGARSPINPSTLWQ